MGERRDSRPQQRPSSGCRAKEQRGALGLGGMCRGEMTLRAGPKQRYHWPNWLLFLSQACPDPHSSLSPFVAPVVLDTILFLREDVDKASYEARLPSVSTD